MRSMTFTHGTLGSLWLEADARGRVIVRTAGRLSAVARAGLLELAIDDLAARSSLPAYVLQALIVGNSTPWPRRVFAWFVKTIRARELSGLEH